MRRRSLIAALGIAVAGCTSDSEPSSEETQNGTPDNTAEETETPASPIRDDTVPIGESVTYNGQVRVTVDEARLANTVTLADNDEPDSRGDDSLFLVIQVSSKNIGEGQVDLAYKNDFALLLGSEQRDLFEFSLGLPPSAMTAPISGDFYDGETDAFAGVSSSGWLVYSVPEEAEHAVIAWGMSSYEVSKQAYWRLNLDPGALPNVQLTSVDVPNVAIRHQPTQIILTIQNTGGSEGTYETTIGDDLYGSPINVSVTVPAGETVEETIELPYPELNYGTRDEATISFGGDEYTDRKSVV